MNLISFLVGLFIGTPVGLFIMALLDISKDDREEIFTKDEK